MYLLLLVKIANHSTSNLLRVHALSATHAPDEEVEGAFIVAVHAAKEIAEIHVPCVGSIAGIGGSRPVPASLHVAKWIAIGDRDELLRRVHQTCQFLKRG